MARRRAVITSYEVERVLSGAKKAGVPMGVLITRDSALFVPVDLIEVEKPASALQRWLADREKEERKEAKNGVAGRA